MAAASLIPPPIGDEVIHQQHRLRMVAALEEEGAPLDFATLKAISGATDGNLGAHLKALEAAGYVTITKEAVGRRQRTWAALTPQGRAAFRRHVAFLQDILNQPLRDGGKATGD